MTIIKGTTKRGQDMLKKSQNCEGKYLSQVYDNFSQAKQNAWDYCSNLFISENGTDFGIISHNTFGFSVAWLTEKGYRIETPKNSYLILWPENC